MTSINDLIKKYCPDGVPYMSLGELGIFYGGLTGKSKKDFESGNARYISYMNIYTNMEVDVSAEDYVQITPDERQNKVALGDVFFTGSSETKDECAISSVLTVLPEGDLYLNSFCFGFRLNNPEMFLPSFLKHLFRSSTIRKALQKTASGVTRFNVSKDKMARVRIPVPPICVQEIIASTLDNYASNNTELISALRAELKARKEQLAYYKSKLFSFDNSIPVYALSKIASFKYGYTDTAKDSGPLRFIRITDINDNGLLKAENAKYIDASEAAKDYFLSFGDLVMARTGATYGKTLFFESDEPSVYASFLIKITFDPDQVLNRYYWHFTKSPQYWKQANKYVLKAGQQQFNTGAIGKVELPVPAMEEQKRIVSELDALENAIRTLSMSLETEMELRLLQYNHYRDSILTFPQSC